MWLWLDCSHHSASPAAERLDLLQLGWGAHIRSRSLQITHSFNSGPLICCLGSSRRAAARWPQGISAWTSGRICLVAHGLSKEQKIIPRSWCPSLSKITFEPRTLFPPPPHTASHLNTGSFFPSPERNKSFVAQVFFKDTSPLSATICLFFFFYDYDFPGFSLFDNFSVALLLRIFSSFYFKLLLVQTSQPFQLSSSFRSRPYSISPNPLRPH